MLRSLAETVPTIGLALDVEFQGLFRILAIGYAGYYSFGLVLPIACGEAMRYSIEGVEKQTFCISSTPVFGT